MLNEVSKVLGLAITLIAWTIMGEESKNLNRIMLMMFLCFLLGLLLTMTALEALKRKVEILQERLTMMEMKTEKLEMDTDNMAALLVEEDFTRY